jgi:hypothetical protein
MGCALDIVTLLDVPEGLGEPRILSLGNASDHSQCAAQQIMNGSLYDASIPESLDREEILSPTALNADPDDPNP